MLWRTEKQGNASGINGPEKSRPPYLESAVLINSSHPLENVSIFLVRLRPIKGHSVKKVRFEFCTAPREQRADYN